MDWLFGSSKKEEEKRLGPKIELKVPKQGELPKLETSTFKMPPKPGFDQPGKPKIDSAQVKKEQDAAESLKGKEPFQLDQEFDLSTYQGRFLSQVKRVNPLLFFTTDKRIKEAVNEHFKYKLREEAASNLGCSVYLKPEEIQRVKENAAIVGSAVHPDTQKIIPFYMRMSGFVVFNMPLVFAVLFTRNQTPVFNAGMQWLNQTYNAGMNYGNRNASSKYTNADLARGYAGAVVTSVGIALVGRTMCAGQLKSLKGGRLIVANAFLNYLAAAFAGSSNLALMRYKELKEGIDVQNKKGNVTYGKSKEAGKKAIKETALSRFVLPLPVLFLPALSMFLLEKMRLWPRGRNLSRVLELGLCMCSLTFALPMSIALFEQRAMIDREHIDTEMQNLKAADFKEPDFGLGKKKDEADEEAKDEIVQKFYFNKGL